MKKAELREQILVLNAELRQERERDNALQRINQDLGRSSKAFKSALIVTTEKLEEVERETTKLREDLRKARRACGILKVNGEPQ
jgi:chromosome segregation ATPase